jgi:hypothetical protein
MANAAGWEPDSQRDDLERYWDGSAWTDELRPAENAVGLDRPPDHVPQLHRALSEAAADLEAVDDRLSTLFERTEDPGRAQVRLATVPPVPVGDEGAQNDDGDDILDLFDDGDRAVEESDDGIGFVEPAVGDRRAIIGEYEDDIGGDFANLDAELAAEEPDKPEKGKRRMFGRRDKGTTVAQR